MAGDSDGARGVAVAIAPQKRAARQRQTSEELAVGAVRYGKRALEHGAMEYWVALEATDRATSGV
ncbi:MAG: hypothetical protein HC881_01520 [Leptolyngbyaceae cyanobacterium SL_7_1]|nr:hypothetical protein [Leptolyngbyaceae cyanobacterium SL_7_1]